MLNEIEKAPHGKAFIYHTGPFCAGPLRIQMMNLSDDGLVVLVQKRHIEHDGLFHYIAIRTRKKWPKV